MKILWVSTGMGGSGYGVQTRLFLHRLRSTGHEVHLFALTHLEGSGSPEIDDFPILPRGTNPAGNDVVRGHFDRVGADVVITLADAHVFDPRVYSSIPWCAYAPVDCSPLAEETRQSLQGARWIWAMSRHGEKQLRDADFDNVSFVPHIVDGAVHSPKNRAECRATVERVTGKPLAGKFLISMVAANNSRPSRKGFFEAFSAFKRFSLAHPESSLYVHSEVTGREYPGGEDLRVVAALAGLDQEEVIFPPQYPLACGDLDQSYLAAVYSASDVFLSSSHGEGFGVPSVEAQMCGCPVILPKNSAQTELCMTGWSVECTEYSPHPGVKWARPNDLTPALKSAWRARNDESLRETTRKRALAYDADEAFKKHVLPALERIAQDLSNKVEPRRRKETQMTSILPASEALRLPSAKLTEEEERMADAICAEINGGIQKNMRLNGFEFTTNCRNPAVVFEVSARLQDAGYVVQPRANLQPSRLNPAQPSLIGYTLVCAPTPEAVRSSRLQIQ